MSKTDITGIAAVEAWMMDYAPRVGLMISYVEGRFEAHPVVGGILASEPGRGVTLVGAIEDARDKLLVLESTEGNDLAETGFERTEEPTEPKLRIVKDEDEQ